MVPCPQAVQAAARACCPILDYIRGFTGGPAVTCCYLAESTTKTVKMSYFGLVSPSSYKRPEASAMHRTTDSSRKQATWIRSHCSI